MSGNDSGNSNVKSVIIPNTVTEIGEKAFYKFSNLSNIEIPDSTTIIKDSAFNKCTSLENVILSKSLKNIGRYAFSGCTSLADIEFPDSILSIGEDAFYQTEWFERLEDGEIYIGNALYTYKGTVSSNGSITIKEGTVSITGHCFRNQSNLVNIYIPKSVTNIGNSAFYGCTRLTSIELPDGINVIESSTFSGCTGLISVKLPEVLTTIGNSAFYGCTRLTSIELPDGINVIESSAFSGCTNLSNIELPDSIVTIGEYAFSGCTGLTNIIIPNLSEIKAGAFRNCRNLEEISMLNGILGIGDYAFYGCSKLYDVQIGNVSEELYQEAIIGRLAFSNCISLVRITLPKNVIQISTGAFSSCTNLEEVKIQGTMRKVEKEAFKNTKISTGTLESYFRDDTITTFIIEEGVGELESNTFLGAENLKSIHIPSTLYYLGDKPFYGCNNLKEVSISSDNPYFVIEDGIIYNKDKTTIIRCLPGKDTKVEIPSTVNSISEYAFIGCSKLKGPLLVPKTLGEVSINAFARCTSEIPLVLEEGLTNIKDYSFANSRFTGNLNIPDSVTYIGYGAFYNCYKFNGNLSLGKKVRILWDEAFYNCYGFTGDLYIPDTLTSIGRGAFQNCTGFNGKLIIGNSMMTLNDHVFMNCIGIKEIEGDINNVHSGTFANCISLINTGNVHNVDGSYAYYGCKNIKEITIKNMGTSTTSWVSNKFDRLISLDTVNIGDETTTLGKLMFARCTNLKTVYIPASVTTIDVTAFYKCNNLQDIYVDNTRDSVTYAEYLESICPNVHYLENTDTTEETLVEGEETTGEDDEGNEVQTTSENAEEKSEDISCEL